MAPRIPWLLALSTLLLCACSKHEDKLRADGLREISGKIYLLVKDQPDFKLVRVPVVAADLEECLRNFKQLRDKRPAGAERDKLAPKDYWEVVGTSYAITKTDAEGKFKILAPAKKPALLCAFILNHSGSGELVPYCWMIRLTDAPVQTFELSNRNNLADGRAVEDLAL